MLQPLEIKKRRKLQGSLKLFGITQRQLAKEIGVKDSMVSHLFTGRRKSPKKFNAIIEILRRINS